MYTIIEYYLQYNIIVTIVYTCIQNIYKKNISKTLCMRARLHVNLYL